MIWLFRIAVDSVHCGACTVYQSTLSWKRTRSVCEDEISGDEQAYSISDTAPHQSKAGGGN